MQRKKAAGSGNHFCRASLCKKVARSPIGEKKRKTKKEKKKLDRASCRARAELQGTNTDHSTLSQPMIDDDAFCFKAVGRTKTLCFKTKHIWSTKALSLLQSSTWETLHTRYSASFQSSSKQQESQQQTFFFIFLFLKEWDTPKRFRSKSKQYEEALTTRFGFKKAAVQYNK